MTEPLSHRHLTRLATAGLVAGAVTALPVSVKVNSTSTISRPDEAVTRPTSDNAGETALLFPDRDFAPNDSGQRRAARARLGLMDSLRYSSPVVLTLSQAAAKEGGGSGGGSGGGGDSGGGGGGSGGGSGGGNSGPGGSGGGSGGGDSETSDASAGSSPSSASAGASAGGPSGGFGGVEQSGPDLSADEEAAAISSGWQ